MIAWLIDVHEAMALIAIVGTVAAAWLQEKREARAEARRNFEVDDVKRQGEQLGAQVDGYLAQIANLEIRIRKLEG